MMNDLQWSTLCECRKYSRVITVYNFLHQDPPDMITMSTFATILPDPPPVTSFNTILHQPTNKVTSTLTDCQEPTTVYQYLT